MYGIVLERIAQLYTRIFEILNFDISRSYCRMVHVREWDFETVICTKPKSVFHFEVLTSERLNPESKISFSISDDNNNYIEPCLDVV